MTDQTIHPHFQLLTVGELRPGDIVRAHGLRCLVTERPILSRSHAGGRTYYTRATVLNRAEVRDLDVPYAFTGDGEGEHFWTLQGNDLATWRVERDW